LFSMRSSAAVSVALQPFSITTTVLRSQITAGPARCRPGADLRACRTAC
jgi:hypothetical protein